jgi:hypothetical protein
MYRGITVLHATLAIVGNAAATALSASITAAAARPAASACRIAAAMAAVPAAVEFHGPGQIAFGPFAFN